MSKKSRRMRARYKASSPPHIDPDTKKNAIGVDIRLSSSVSQRVSVVNQDSQYKYIVPELVRICVIAGIFFVIIVVLSFVLN